MFAIITASQVSWGALAPSISAPGQGITIKGSFSIFQIQLKWGERGHHLNTQNDVRKGGAGSQRFMELFFLLINSAFFFKKKIHQRWR